MPSICSSAPDSAPPTTEEIGIATMNHAIARVRYPGGKPVAEVERDARKEAGFRRAEQEAQEVEAPRALHEDRRGGNQAPADHDPREPGARADAVEDHVARHFEEAVAEKQDAGAAAELRRRQPELAVHRQRGEADVVAVEVVEDVRDGQDRQQPPGNFLEDAASSIGMATVYSALMRFRATLCCLLLSACFVRRPPRSRSAALNPIRTC